ncbi:MAG TPA: D-alanyl-D-alanine carboxypeptidase family protein [Candidatus Binatia bacterium]|nr:D-alanyl-D-alanine carboxypeptidase family protein [Candidatus Binatia bacterium]
MRKAIFALFLALCTLVAGATGGRADAVKPAGLVVDAESGKILVSNRASTLWYPASLTKMMTAYVVFSEIAAGHLAMDTQITVSAASVNQPPTKFGFRIGQKITVQQALQAMLVSSSNDAAVALAEQVAGSESAFVERMNAAAQSLGMVSTRYRNANGLPDDAQVTTARDQAVLAMALIHDFPDRYAMFSLRSVTIAGRSQPTVNGLPSSYPGADGMKTGFTCGSGYNIVGSAQRGGQRLVAVLLGAQDRDQRSAMIRKLLDTGFAGGDSIPPAISSIAMVPAALDSGSAPTVLSGSECDASNTSDVESAASARFPGWGVIFGAFPSPDQAHQALGSMQQHLKGSVGGRPAVVMRQLEGGKRYVALLVGLKSSDAGRTCKTLWQESKYCLALNPKVLNDPSAMWR